MDIIRRREGRWLGGVCAGLADHFALSRAAVRIGVVLLAVAAGPAVIVAYLAAWAFFPAEDAGAHPPAPKRRRSGIRILSRDVNACRDDPGTLKRTFA